MLMTTWYPAGYSALGYGIRQGTLAVGVTTAINVFREFSPELKRTFRKFAERAEVSQPRSTLP
jgi:hypothetical protein